MKEEVRDRVRAERVSVPVMRVSAAVVRAVAARAWVKVGTVLAAVMIGLEVVVTATEVEPEAAASEAAALQAAAWGLGTEKGATEAAVWDAAVGTGMRSSDQPLLPCGRSGCAPR